MKVLIVQHVECEGPGYLEDFIHKKGIEYEIARMYEEEQLPDNFDALVVLGGPMNVYEEERYPYLKPLTTTMKDFVTEGGHYLGICLGGQLLAKALGAKVRRNHTKVIGNFEIHLTEKGVEDPLFNGFEHIFPALEWHEDTFEIPEGGLKLAESKLCANQAFRFKNAYGLQFHLETPPGMLKKWTEVYEGELNEEGVNAPVLIEETKKRAGIYRELSSRLLTNFFFLANEEV
ncbi:MAG: type 1 glutamine amidotransferase [Halobacteriota archaeon]